MEAFEPTGEETFVPSAELYAEMASLASDLSLYENIAFLRSINPAALNFTPSDRSAGSSNDNSAVFRVKLEQVLTEPKRRLSRLATGGDPKSFRACDFFYDWAYNTRSSFIVTVEDVDQCLSTAEQDFSQVEQRYTELRSIYRGIGSSIDEQVEALSKELETVDQDLQENARDLERLQTELFQRDAGLTISDSADRVIRYTLLAWVVVAVIITVSIANPFVKVRDRDTSNGNRRLLLEVMTVFILTAAILVLGIAGKLHSEVLGTLIGGISGYVLGKLRESEPRQ